MNKETTMNYYDKKLNIVLTEQLLIARGLSPYMDLSSIEIYPIRYEYKQFNQYTQKQEPVNGVHVDPFNPKQYVQDFQVTNLSGDELVSAQERQKRDEASQRLSKIDEESVRSIHANVSGTATEQDMLYLIENELTKQKIRTELENKEYDKNYSDSLKIRMWRDYLLDSTDWLVLRYSEQPSSLTELQHNELIIYRQELRNLPNKEGFPWDGDLTKTPFPTKPDFI